MEKILIGKEKSREEKETCLKWDVLNVPNGIYTKEFVVQRYLRTKPDIEL
jgi:hypothetical protein